MKIAVDIRDAGGEKAGKGFYAYGLINELLSLDNENNYILYTDSAETPFTKKPNCEIRKIDQKGLKWHLKVLADLKKEKPDYFFTPTSFIIPALAPAWLKTIIVVHDLVSFLYPKRHNKKAVLIERLTLKPALKKAARLISISENTALDLVKYFKYDRDKIKIIYPAPHPYYFEKISPQQLGKIRKKYNLPERFILGVGTIEPRKNFVNLIKAFVIVQRKFPEIKLVIAGKKGWQHQEVDRTIRELQMKENVIMTGYVGENDLPALYQMAEIFVFPSIYEGFGIPPLEAMASGCPVVSSNTSSLPEVIGEAGLMVDPKSSIKIADAIISFLENSQVAEMYRERGLEQAKKFTWSDSGLFLKQLIDDLKNSEEETAS